MSITQYQHGDVVIEKGKIPKTAKDIKTNVLQEGEHTGHAHRLYGEGFTVLEEPKTRVKYLRVVEPVALRHEEHHERIVPPGDYVIHIVKEYDHFTEEARRVAD